MIPPLSGLDIGGKLKLTDARREREDKRADQQRRGPDPANTIEKQQRMRQRREKQRERVMGNPDLPNQKDTVAGYFIKGYLKLTLVNNVDEGYVLVSTPGLGGVLLPAQIAYLQADRMQRVAMGLPPLDVLPWERENQGILQYGPATDALEAVGFGKFVNFFGRVDTSYYAMEVPLATELGLFRSDWFSDPPQQFDQNWAAGGDGPYISQPDILAPTALDGPEVPIDGNDDNPDPDALARIAEEEAYYASYVRLRAEQPGTYDMDRQLPVAPPTIVETSEGAVPPSQAAGNPGLGPIPEGSETLPPTASPQEIKAWADQFVVGCWRMTVERNHNDIDGRAYRPSRFDIEQQGQRLYRDDFFDAADEPWLVDLRAEIDGARDNWGYERAPLMAAIAAQVQKYLDRVEPWPEVKPHLDGPAASLVAALDHKLADMRRSAEARGYPYMPGQQELDSAADGVKNLIEERIFRDPIPDQLVLSELTKIMDAAFVFRPVQGWMHASKWQLTNEILNFVFMKYPEVRAALDRDRPQGGGSGGPGAYVYIWESAWKARVEAMGPLFEPMSPSYSMGTPGAPGSAPPSTPPGTRPGAPSPGASSDSAPPRASAVVPPGGPPDAPPSSRANSRSVQEVQVAVVKRSAQMVRPPATAYHPIVDITTTHLWTKTLRAMGTPGAPGVWTSDQIAKILIPTISKRSDVFFIKTAPLKQWTNLHGFFTDQSYAVTGAYYQMKAGTPLRKQPLIPGKIFNPSDIDGNKDDPTTDVTFATQADHVQSLGFFGSEQLQHVYEHMVHRGNVMFSVNLGKAMQFFPAEFVCSNVWWWESRLNQKPQSLEWDKIGSGSFNKAYRLRNADVTQGRLPDHFLFLPPTRIGYGMTLGQPGIEKAFAPTKQNGMIMRIAYYPGLGGDPYGMQSVVRELMLSALASSAGFGTKIYAAYVIPAGAYPPSIAMNPRDANAAFADPLYRAEYGQTPPGPQPHNKPTHAWYASRTYWDVTGIRVAPGPAFVSPSFETAKQNPWRKMVVVMESFADHVGELRMENDQQNGAMATALWKSLEKMSETGFLHMDIKYLNMVQRTWRKDNTEVTRANPWNAVEIRAIDFDPKFVKLCPWLPKEVLLLIHIVCYMAFNKCFDKHPGVYGKLSKKINDLHKLVNERYPDGIAGAFRALMPPINETRGPANLPGVPGYTNPRVDRSDTAIFQMFNDEWEAARVFYHWFDNYMQTRACSNAFSNGPTGTSMLARLMSYAKVNSLRQANPPADARKPGVFDIGGAASGGACGAKGSDASDDKGDQISVSIDMGRGLWGDIYDFEMKK